MNIMSGENQILTKVNKLIWDGDEKIFDKHVKNPPSYLLKSAKLHFKYLKDNNLQYVLDNITYIHPATVDHILKHHLMPTVDIIKLTLNPNVINYMLILQYILQYYRDELISVIDDIDGILLALVITLVTQKDDKLTFEILSRLSPDLLTYTITSCYAIEDITYLYRIYPDILQLPDVISYITDVIIDNASDKRTCKLISDLNQYLIPDTLVHLLLDTYTLEPVFQTLMDYIDFKNVGPFTFNTVLTEDRLKERIRRLKSKGIFKILFERSNMSTLYPTLDFKDDYVKPMVKYTDIVFTFQ